MRPTRLPMFDLPKMRGRGAEVGSCGVHKGAWAAWAVVTGDGRARCGFAACPPGGERYAGLYAQFAAALDAADLAEETGVVLVADPAVIQALTGGLRRAGQLDAALGGAVSQLRAAAGRIPDLRWEVEREVAGGQIDARFRAEPRRLAGLLAQLLNDYGPGLAHDAVTGVLADPARIAVTGSSNRLPRLYWSVCRRNGLGEPSGSPRSAPEVIEVSEQMREAGWDVRYTYSRDERHVSLIGETPDRPRLIIRAHLEGGSDGEPWRIDTTTIQRSGRDWTSALPAGRLCEALALEPHQRLTWMAGLRTPLNAPPMTEPSVP